MTPEAAYEISQRLVASMYGINADATATEMARSEIADALLAAVAAERERCAAIAAKDDWYCMNQKCHEVIVQAIREVST